MYFKDSLKSVMDVSSVIGEHPKEHLPMKEVQTEDVKFWQEMIKVKDIWNFGYPQDTFDDDDEDEEPQPDFLYLKDNSYLALCSLTQQLDKGQCLLANYGKKSNSNLLLHYCFAYQNNPYDYAELTLNQDEFFYLKQDRLNQELLTALRKCPISTDLLLEMKTMFVYRELC